MLQEEGHLGGRRRQRASEGAQGVAQSDAQAPATANAANAEAAAAAAATAADPDALLIDAEELLARLQQGTDERPIADEHHAHRRQRAHGRVVGASHCHSPPHGAVGGGEGECEAKAVGGGAACCVAA